MKPVRWLASLFLSVTSNVVVAAPTNAPATAPHTNAYSQPPLIRIEGNAHTRGMTYGKRFREAIRSFLATEIDAAFIGKPASRGQLRHYAAACGDVVRQECPLIAEEFAGIAEGAGMTFEDIMLINLHEELYHRVNLPETAGPKHGHCTAVAVSSSDSGNAKTYVGQTWDWMPSVAGKSAILEWRRSDGVSVLAYGFPGMPMGAGISASGIALCWTSAALGEKGQSPRVGIPSYILIAHLLAQKDLESVIREARKNKHAGWFTFVMADGDGNLLNIEGSPTRVAIERAKQSLVRVFYGSQEMTGTAPGQPISAHPRCERMRALLENSRGRNDLARLQEYFAQPNHRISEGKGTIDLLVFDTTSRVAHMSRGTSYHLDWRTFAFGSEK
jgi:isopenicillin-N N-acyltransferase-like protein